ncbi:MULTISPECIES: hypothetical protein [Paenibacillus]|nr:hypothetical protein [Paenibacillus caseinilyticus]MCZ8518925.1 hypothetical protein [Paenibacillus caseinilyticus]
MSVTSLEKKHRQPQLRELAHPLTCDILPFCIHLGRTVDRLLFGEDAFP